MKTQLLFVSLMLPVSGLFALPTEYIDLYGDPFTPLAIAEAVRTDGPITLDGVGDEPVWAIAPSYRLGYATFPLGGNQWDSPINAVLSDPEDFDVHFQAAWDDTYLYLLITVTDDVIVVDSTGTSYENDDGVEIYLDGDNSRDVGTNWNEQGYDDINDRQLKVKADNTTPPIGGLWDPQRNGRTIVAQDIVIERTFKETETGYILELRMNFSGIFRGAVSDGSMVQEVAEGTYFGFDLKASDDDDGGLREIAHGWAVESNNSYADVSIFGTMVLVVNGGGQPAVSPWENVAVSEGTDIKETGIGYIVDKHFPWIYSFPLRSYIYVYSSVSDSKDSVYGHVMSLDQPVWMNDSIGWGYNLADQEWVKF